MKRTGILIDPIFEQHLTPSGHPECPERMTVLLEFVNRYQRDGLLRIQPRPAVADEIGWNHDRAYVSQVAATADRGFYEFEPETRTSDKSYQAACMAAGGLMSVIDAVVAGQVDNGFAFVRPPGHHAEYAQAMGFCLFNNVAIGARHLINSHQLDRVLILDWDVHHGNGTQHSFYGSKNVLFMSLHQWPHYPGTGAAEDVGSGAGAGFNVNVPLPASCGDEEYLAVLDHTLLPIARQFHPQFVLVSAGFDAHARDPLGGMRLSDAGFGAMTQRLLDLADQCCDGRLVLSLEGGYDLNALQSSSEAVLDALGGGASPDGIQPSASSIHAFHRVNDIQRRYWSF